MTRCVSACSGFRVRESLPEPEQRHRRWNGSGNSVHFSRIFLVYENAGTEGDSGCVGLGDEGQCRIIAAPDGAR